MLLVIWALVLGTSNPEELKPVPGRTLEVRASARVAPGRYVLPPQGADGRQGAIRIEGARGLELDLTGCELRGTPAGTDLDRNAGWGIVLVDCQDVTLKGGQIGGFKACVVAERCQRLVLDGLGFEGWYGMRLLSNVAAEDGSDWLYPHQNDAGEWTLNYGAAISLTDCVDARVRGCKGRHGQNGILLTRSDAAQVFDCDFSFLSGWGLALYRSSKSVVSRNLFDYCVRGYSHEAYWRGQDSAGILMFERCSDNLFAFNSATHGGDGVFLFAGRDSVEGKAAERGEQDAGGCDRNVWFRNDLSYAVANAIEATFSRDNWALYNLLDGSHQHGVWGGYSSRMVVLGNSIRGTLGGGVSIEHGQECAVVENQLERNEMGVELWWDEDPELVGGPFGKTHDTASRDHWIYGNAFARNAKDLVLRQTSGVRLGGNAFDGTGEMRMEKTRVEGGEATGWMTGKNGITAGGEVLESRVRTWDGKEPEWVRRARAWKCPELPGTQRVFARERGEKQGLDTIVMGEWGPWDFRAGEPRPAPRLPGGLLKDTTWIGTWFSWKDGPDPREKAAEWRALSGKPLAIETAPNFVDPWARDPKLRKLVGNDRFGLLAVAEVGLVEAGRYRLVIVSDDGVRLNVDGKVALENWTWHAPTRDEALLELAAGKHKLELEYFQIDGATALSVELSKVE